MIAVLVVVVVGCVCFYAGRKDADMDARAEIERLSRELVLRDELLTVQHPDNAPSPN